MKTGRGTAACGFESHGFRLSRPGRLTGKAACLRHREWGFESLPGHFDEGLEALVEQSGVLATLSRWRPWVQIPSRALRQPGTVRQPAQRPGPNPGVCGFESHPCHHLIAPSSSGPGRHPLTVERRVRLPPGLLLIASDRSKRPGRQTGKAASLRGWCLWVRLPPRPSVSSSRFRGTFVPWSSGTTPGPHPGNGGSTPPGTTRRIGHGRLVKRNDAWLATRRSGFDSPAVHSVLSSRTRALVSTGG